MDVAKYESPSKVDATHTCVELDANSTTLPLERPANSSNPEAINPVLSRRSTLLIPVVCPDLPIAYVGVLEGTRTIEQPSIPGLRI